MSVSIALFTRDLRVHDNPVLHAAAERGAVVPLFVLDPDAGEFAGPNRRRFLDESLHDLDKSLRRRGGRLVLRHGDPAEEVCRVVRSTGASAVHLAADATSRLSPYLHFGCVSPVELIRGCGRSAGAREFVRQLAWREFHLQVLAARPDVAWRDYRHRGEWREDADALAAWREGMTGHPLVDAGMRQLLAEGWMHNRARLVTGSFLTKTLGLDWRAGAAHFFAHLVDGDVANNCLNWQWVAGTGLDTRPNRALSPLRQAERFDPSRAYVRRWVPELDSGSYPDPIVPQSRRT